MTMTIIPQQIIVNETKTVTKLAAPTKTKTKIL